MSKYPNCESCLFYNREPTICEGCYEESQYIPDDEDFGDDEDEDFEDKLLEAA